MLLRWYYKTINSSCYVGTIKQLTQAVTLVL